MSPATSSKILTSDNFSKPETPINTQAVELVDVKPSFSYPYQFKTSDFEISLANLIDLTNSNEDDIYFTKRTLRPITSQIVRGHVISSRIKLDFQSTTRLKDFMAWKLHQQLAIRSDPYASIASGDLKLAKKTGTGPTADYAQSAPPNPFVAKAFELSFVVEPWWEMMERMQDGNVEAEAGTRQHKVARKILVDEDGRIMRSEPAKKPKPEPQFANVPAPPLRMKIPWKGKSIIVRLPPVKPVSPSTRSL
jgi:hypothetical protein